MKEFEKGVMFYTEFYSNIEVSQIFDGNRIGQLRICCIAGREMQAGTDCKRL